MNHGLMLPFLIDCTLFKRCVMFTPSICGTPPVFKETTGVVGTGIETCWLWRSNRALFPICHLSGWGSVQFCWKNVEIAGDDESGLIENNVMSDIWKKDIKRSRVGWIILDKMFVGNWLLIWELFGSVKHRNLPRSGLSRFMIESSHASSSTVGLCCFFMIWTLLFQQNSKHRSLETNVCDSIHDIQKFNKKQVWLLFCVGCFTHVILKKLFTIST